MTTLERVVAELQFTGLTIEFADARVIKVRNAHGRRAQVHRWSEGTPAQITAMAKAELARSIPPK